MGKHKKNWQRFEKKSFGSNTNWLDGESVKKITVKKLLVYESVK